MTHADIGIERLLISYIDLILAVQTNVCNWPIADAARSVQGDVGSKGALCLVLARARAINADFEQYPRHSFRVDHRITRPFARNRSQAARS